MEINPVHLIIKGISYFSLPNSPPGIPGCPGLPAGSLASCPQILATGHKYKAAATTLGFEGVQAPLPAVRVLLRVLVHYIDDVQHH